MSRLVIWLAARLVPGTRRAEWLERWRAELWTLNQSASGHRPQPARLRFALGAVPDAVAESVDGFRDAWAWSGLLADVRGAWRSSVAAPGVTLTAIGILGFGAAGAATIFSLADTLLLRPLPGLEAPDRLVQIGRKDPANFDNFSYPNYRDLRDGLAGTIDLAGWANTSVVVGEGPSTDVVRAQLVTANYFRVVGARTAGGPGLVASTDESFRDRAEAVVSDGFWRQHGAAIDADEGIVAIDGQPFRVVGVTPPGFVGVDAGSSAPHVWIPLLALGRADMGERMGDRGWSWLQAIGRVAPDVPIPAAREATVALHARLAEDHAATIGDTVTFVEGAGLDPPGRALAGQLIGVLMAAAGLVLVVASANVAGLQFARNLGRRHELAIRLSLGASRRRVVRGLLIEQGLMAALAGAFAFMLTWWTSAWLLSVLPYDVAVTLGPTPRQLLFALAVSVAATALVGLWPLVAVVRSVPGDLLHSTRFAPRRLLAGRVLVGVELAVSAVLLCLTALMARSVLESTRVDPGFDTAGVVTVALRPLPGRSSDAGAVVAEALQRLQAVPGAGGAAAATALPVVDPQSSSVLSLPGAESSTDPARIPVVTADVTADFFETLRIPITAGRALDARDRTDGEVPVVVNEPLAGWAFPGEPAVGRTIAAGPVTYRVVGVAASTSLRSVRDRALPAMWRPADPSGGAPLRLVVRVDGDAAAAPGAIRAALEPMAGDVMVRAVEPLDAAVAGSLGTTRLMAQLAVVFGGLALLISAVGLHAVSSAQVQGRRHEIGVRLAIGASPRRVVQTILRSAILTAMAGSAAGVAGVVLAGSHLRAFLFNVEPADPAAMVATVAVLSLTSIAAVIGPARRAGRTDPLIVMREP